MFIYFLVVSRGYILLISIYPMLEIGKNYLSQLYLQFYLKITYIQKEAKIQQLFAELYKNSTDCFVLVVLRAFQVFWLCLESLSFGFYLPFPGLIKTNLPVLTNLSNLLVSLPLISHFFFSFFFFLLLFACFSALLLIFNIRKPEMSHPSPITSFESVFVYI